MTNNTQSPFVFSPSQFFEGNDGSWSTFIIRVGTPPQLFRVLPSLQGSQTWVPLPEGCIASDPPNCPQLRGVYDFEGRPSPGFQITSSSTWKPIGLYELHLGRELGLRGNGHFGFDTMGLQVQNSGGVTLENQVVAGIATKDFYLGIFGLGVKPTNFSTFEHPQPSFLKSLYDERKVPSLSLAYTAGASYRIPKLPGSLVLGGYDTSRFLPSGKTFQFSANDDKPLSIGLQALTATNTLHGTVNPLSRRILTYIDSTSPHIWLPERTCENIASAFGLTYDDSTDLYTVNDTMRSRLLDLSPSLTFSLGNDDNPADMVTITLPYAAFDLHASHPIYANKTNYFPIRRAKNENQYVLGRTFLQEAYIIADYERASFEVHKARFESTMPEENIITIPSLSNSTDTNGTESNGSKGTGLPTTTVLGLGVGLGVGVGVILLLLLVCLARRRRQKREEANGAMRCADGRVAEADASRVYEVEALPVEVPSYSKQQDAWEVEAKVKKWALLSDDFADKKADKQAEKYELPA